MIFVARAKISNVAHILSTKVELTFNAVGKPASLLEISQDFVLNLLKYLDFEENRINKLMEIYNYFILMN